MDELEYSNGKCLHVVLFGTFNESVYFLGDYKDCFDLIGFNANIIAHAPEGMAAFVSKLKRKKYFIDPQTYAFQQEVKTVLRKKDGVPVIKNSIEKLSNHYGSIIKEKAGRQRINASELDTGAILEICENVLLFQHNILFNASKELDVREFLEEPEIDLRPEFLIAPYLFNEADDYANELQKNNEFISCCRDFISRNIPNYNSRLFAEIVIGKEILIDNIKLERLTELYRDCGADGFVLWIDEFSEMQISEDTLRKYLGFLRNLNRINKPIIMMHGSFMSVAFAGVNLGLLAGVGHGIEYGESRSVVPVGGGVPLAKYYFPRFFKRVDYSPDAVDILIEMGWDNSKLHFHDNVCDCRQCCSTITDKVQNSFDEYGKTKISEKDGRAYPIAEAMNKSRKHYLNCKIEEYNFGRSSSQSAIIDKLTASEELSKEIRSHSFNHISKWKRILNQ